MMPIYWPDPTSGQATSCRCRCRRRDELGDRDRHHARPAPRDDGADAERPRLRPGDGTTGAAAGGASSSATWRRSARRRCPARSTATTCGGMVSITANVGGAGPGPGAAGRCVQADRRGRRAAARACTVDVRGQVETLDVVQSSLGRGLLRGGAGDLPAARRPTSSRSGWRWSSVAAIPATLCGVGAHARWLTGTTLNLQSFMGAIMALGVAVANAILLVTFAERPGWLHGGSVARPRWRAGGARLRPILMTSCAMIAGMLPMALGLTRRRRADRPAGPGRHRRAGRLDAGDAARPAGGVRGGAAEGGASPARRSTRTTRTAASTTTTMFGCSRTGSNGRRLRRRDAATGRSPQLHPLDSPQSIGLQTL